MLILALCLALATPEAGEADSPAEAVREHAAAWLRAW